MEFVIITGLSGAGKSTALHALEDMDFYCVDNLPPELIPTFYSLCDKSDEKRMQNVAIVTNIWEADDYEALTQALQELEKENQKYKILFIDANLDVLLVRYKETRRKHPLNNNLGSTTEAVKTENELLKRIKERSNYLIDSTYLKPMQLKNQVTELFAADAGAGIAVTCLSFGFKYGIPLEADLVFDVRCLPNPFYIKELKGKTGVDKEVQDYVMNSEKTKGLIDRIIDLVDFSLPLYSEEGKNQLVVGIGCTGGKHRSVTLAEYLCKHLQGKGVRAGVLHRDIKK